MLMFRHLSQLRGVRHGITEREDVVPSGLTYGEQVHKDRMAWVDVSREDAPSSVPKEALYRGVDALFTRATGVGLGVRVADCVPVLCADERNGVVGVIHAGWRGTALEITRKTLESLKFPLHQLRVGLGPAICPNCFVVGEEVARQFPASCVTESAQEEGKFHVDLWQANVLQCLEVGVAERNIEVMRACTMETPTLFSFRRGDRDDRSVAFIFRT